MVVLCLTCKWVGHGSGILHEESWSTLLIFTTRITSAPHFARNSFIYKQGRTRQENLVNVKSTHNRIFWSHKYQQGLCCPFCNTGWSISLTYLKITKNDITKFWHSPKKYDFFKIYFKMLLRNGELYSGNKVRTCAASQGFKNFQFANNQIFVERNIIQFCQFTITAKHLWIWGHLKFHLLECMQRKLSASAREKIHFTKHIW